MLRCLTRKASGDSTVIAALIANILSLCVFYVLVSVLLDSQATLNQNNDIQGVCDTYLEGMMAQGYLTPENEKQLTAALTSLGASQIDYTGSTRNVVAYGDRLVLSVRYRVEVNRHPVTGFLLYSSKKENSTRSYCRYATSYH